jgi:hypothetical protein
MSASVADQVVFRFSRWMHIGLAVLALAPVPFLAYAIVLLHGYGLWLWQILGIFEVALCGAVFFFCIARAFDRRPGLIVDRQGFIDRTDYFGAVRIDWTAVRGIRTVRILMVRNLVVDVYDPRRFVARGNAFRWLMRARNMWLLGSPISLTSIALDTNFDQMARLVGEFFEPAKAAEKPPLSSGSGGV